MSNDRKILNVPIKPHLKKYLLKMTDLPEPFRLDEHTSVGKNLIRALRDPWKTPLPSPNMNDRLTEMLAIELSARAAHLRPKIGQLIQINSLLDEMFQEGLIGWIFAQSQVGVNPYNSCKSFLFFYAIDDNDYSYDAAYKTWTRYRSSTKSALRGYGKVKPFMT